MKYLFSLFLLSAIPVSAESLTLSGALARVEAGHPWLRTRDSVSALAAARASIATTTPAPEVSLQFENALGTGELRGTRSMETTLQFSRALDWSGRRNARAAVAGALSETELMEWEARRLELLAEVARRFIRVVAAQADLSAIQQVERLSQQTLSIIEARAVEAATSPVEVARARLAFAEVELEAEHAEHQLLSARQSLATLWGAESPDFESADADLTTLPDVATYETMADRLASAPVQARFAALLRWRMAQEKLARTTATRGDPRWSAGLRRSESTDDFGLVLGINYGWRNPGLAGAQGAEARAERDRTAAEGESALFEARAVLFELCQELNHARTEHRSVRHEMLPAAESWLASIESGYAAGRYGLRDLLEARTTEFAAQRRQIKAAADYHLTLVAIEQLLGGPANP